MPRIPFPSDETGPVWEEVRRARGGRVSKTFRLLGWSPPVQALTLHRLQALSQGRLGHRFHEAVAYAVSADNTCHR